MMLCSAYFALVRFVGSFYAVTRQVSVASRCFFFCACSLNCAGCFNCSNCFWCKTIEFSGVVAARSGS